MTKMPKLDAQAQLTANQNAAKKVLKEKEHARQERSEQVARQRALRRAKEAADLRATEKIIAEKSLAKVKKSKNLSQSR